MADAKYGPLYTAPDVAEIALEFATMTLARVRAGDTSPKTKEEIRAMVVKAIEAVSADLTFPEDEPLFVLRGQDEAAPDAIATSGRESMSGRRYPIDYLQSCLNREAPKGHVKKVWEAAAAMRDWQAANPRRVGRPD